METQTQQRLRKFRRQPERINPILTPPTLDVLSLIARYGLISTSLILHLLPRHHKLTYRHLQSLYHHGFLNRFSTALLGGTGEMIYYLDNPATLHLLSDKTDVDPDTLPWEQVKRNRDRPYTALFDRRDPARALGRLLFVDHELMISRFRAHLELACQAHGDVVLANWRQGSRIEHSVNVPKIVRRGKAEYVETNDTHRLPLCPDALFTLHFPKAPEGQRYSHFFYEADRRRSTDTKRFRRKLRAYFYCLTAGTAPQRQARMLELFNIPRARAVLIETLDDPWRERLRKVAAHPAVRPDKPTSMFWFAHNQPYLEKTALTGSQRPQPAFLSRPLTIFEQIWKVPTLTPQTHDKAYSLLD